MVYFASSFFLHIFNSFVCVCKYPVFSSFNTDLKRSVNSEDRGGLFGVKGLRNASIIAILWVSVD